MVRTLVERIILLVAEDFFLLPVLAGSARAQAADSSAIASYRLGSGDKLKISVYGQTDLNGDYEIDGSGNIELPLIGQIKAAGLTVADFKRDLTTRLGNGFFVNPNVSVEVENYRPFYIIGEVNKPGEYPYVNGMSILNAVALAGGYTTRADDSSTYIRRNGQSKEIELPADETTKVEPGDIIRVPERYF